MPAVGGLGNSNLNLLNCSKIPMIGLVSFVFNLLVQTGLVLIMVYPKTIN